VRFIDKHRRPGELVQFPETVGLLTSESLEELNRRCNNDGRFPKRGEVPKIWLFELGVVMMRRDDLLWIFAGKDERLAVHLHGFLNNVRKGHNNEDVSQSQRMCCLKQIGHDCRGLPAAHRTVASPDRRFWGSGTACIVNPGA
jgi:hypothetical protein